jgi:hypothetical protein
MNIPLFQWIILATYVTFIEPRDLVRAWNWILGRIHARLGTPLVAYEATAPVRARSEGGQRQGASKKLLKEVPAGK